MNRKTLIRNLIRFFVFAVIIILIFGVTDEAKYLIMGWGAGLAWNSPSYGDHMQTEDER